MTGRAAYAGAFLARHAAWGGAVLDEPGFCGATSSADASVVRLLVTDDEAHDELAVLLPTVRAGLIDAFAEASRCAALVDEHLRWTSRASTAMVCRDLRTAPATALPDELALRPVQRSSGDASDGVPLEDAVALAVLSDPTLVESPAVLARDLRSLMPAFRFLAAVDSDGVVRATSGLGLFGRQATVIFVSTDPGWRLRGIGGAMTAAALGAARAAGASQAGLNASDAGSSIYRRLGFEVISRITRFSGPA